MPSIAAAPLVGLWSVCVSCRFSGFNQPIRNFFQSVLQCRHIGVAVIEQGSRSKSAAIATMTETYDRSGAIREERIDPLVQSIQWNFACMANGSTAEFRWITHINQYSATIKLLLQVVRLQLFDPRSVCSSPTQKAFIVKVHSVLSSWL